MLKIKEEILAQIFTHGEEAYPEEGAGFLLGYDDGDQRHVAPTGVGGGDDGRPFPNLGW